MSRAMADCRKPQRGSCPRSSADRAPASGAGCAGSSPAGGAFFSWDDAIVEPPWVSWRLLIHEHARSVTGRSGPDRKLAGLEANSLGSHDAVAYLRRQRGSSSEGPLLEGGAVVESEKVERRAVAAFHLSLPQGGANGEA
jgi:hypothetical protein